MFRALPVKLRDVSGAGDTVAAALALALAAGADWEAALRTANAAAASQSARRAPQTVTPESCGEKSCHGSLAAEEKIVGNGGESRNASFARGAGRNCASASQWLLRHPASRPRQGVDRGRGACDG